MNLAILDFETLGTRPDSIVVSAAICIFDINDEPDFKRNLINTKSFKFNIEEQKKAGRTVSKDTILWWSEQSEEAKSILIPSNIDCSLESFFVELKNIINRDKIQKLCARNIHFDMPILANIVESLGFDTRYEPIPFWNMIDTPSFIAGLQCDPIKSKIMVRPDGFIAHKADHDVACEAWYLQYIMNELSNE